VPPILGWQTFYTPRIAVALGILVVGWALAILIRFGIARRNAGSMKRAMIEETDERQLLIRSRAGYDAFTLSIPTTAIGLILYSAISRDLPQPDPFWYYMIFMTLLPIVIYVFRTLKYAKEY
jgi:ABC-type tungstate transport system substrate-binding protein